MGGGRDASQSDFGGSSSGGYSGGQGGGRDASQPDFSPPSAGGNNDNKDPTVQYQNTPPLSTEAKEALAAQRQKAQYEISPMTDPKNKAIALGLNLIVPFGGTLFGAYKNATAMGYSVQNPFAGIFEGGEPTLEDIENLRGDGDNRDIQTQVISQAPFAITQTEATPSIVNEYFANLNIGQQASSDLQTRYNSAKSNITNILNLKSVEDQYGYVAQPNLLNLNLKGLI